MPEPSRRRGRPPASSGAETKERLIECSFELCLEKGFEGVSLADIADRAGVTPNAVYNHFDTKSALILATARRALEEFRVPPARTGDDAAARARAISLAFLHPGAARSRLVLSELNIAARRNPDIAALVSAWNRSTLTQLRQETGPRSRADDPARAKAFYVLLMGACMLEAFDDLEAPPRRVSQALSDAAAMIFEHTPR